MMHRQHIKSILQHTTEVTESNIDRWVGDVYAEKWELSRTHGSHSNNNYEKIEFLGDKLANSIIAIYVSIKYPEVESTTYLTKLQNYLQSREILSLASNKLGLGKHVLASESIADVLARPFTDELKNDSTWKKVNTDLFESFVGTLYTVVKHDTASEGVAYQIVYNTVFQTIDEVVGVIDFENLVDPVTRFKEGMDMARFAAGIQASDRSTIQNDIFKYDASVSSEAEKRGESVYHRFSVTFPTKMFADNNNIVAVGKLRNIPPNQKIVIYGDFMTDKKMAKADMSKKAHMVWKNEGYPVKSYAHTATKPNVHKDENKYVPL